MERRDLLRAFGTATALALLPQHALAAWERVATRLRPTNGLTDAQLSLIGAIADTILPRTDTPSATDVGVPAFVDIIVSENYDDAERATFVAGLDAFDAHAQTVAGAAFLELPGAGRATAIERIEAGSRDAEPRRSYWRLKGLIVHGYFTSESVMKNVLKVQVMPGKFDGDAPVTLKRARPPRPAAGGDNGGHAHA